MGKKEVKRLVSFLDEVGYKYARRNTKGIDVYKHADPRLPLQSVYDGLDEKLVEAKIASVCRILGMDAPGSGQKRKPQQIKERRQAERERTLAEIERNKVELAELASQRESAQREAIAERERRDSQLGGLAEFMTNTEIEAITRLIHEKEEEGLRLLKLLSRSPEPIANNARLRS